MRPSERGRLESLDTPSLIAARIKEADAGAISFLIAWLGDDPVGHVLVRWLTDTPKYAALPRGVPVLEWLGVAAGHRNAGIGTALMEAAEELARSRGHDGILLSVGVENHGARRLYQRRGYREMGLEPQYLGWTFIGRDGVERTEGEYVTWMMKETDR